MVTSAQATGPGLEAQQYAPHTAGETQGEAACQQKLPDCPPAVAFFLNWLLWDSILAAFRIEAGARNHWTFWHTRQTSIRDPRLTLELPELQRNILHSSRVEGRGKSQITLCSDRCVRFFTRLADVARLITQQMPMNLVKGKNENPCCAVST